MWSNLFLLFFTFFFKKKTFFRVFISMSNFCCIHLAIASHWGAPSIFPCRLEQLERKLPYSNLNTILSLLLPSTTSSCVSNDLNDEVPEKIRPLNIFSFTEEKVFLSASLVHLVEVVRRCRHAKCDLCGSASKTYQQTNKQAGKQHEWP